jgi:head-tail adaptor
MMDAGELKHRILLETIARSQNTVGQLVEVWTAVGSLWAKMEDATGSEGERDDIISAVLKSDFTIRFRALNATDFRFVYNTQVFDIEFIKEEEFKKWLKVRAVKRSSFSPYNSVEGGSTVSVQSFAWLWLTGLYFDSFKNNTYLVAGVNRVYSGMPSDFALITNVSLPNKDLLTDFTNEFFGWFDNLVTIDLSENDINVFETAELSAVTSIDLSDNLLTAFDATETPLLTTIDLSNNLLNYLANSQVFIDLDANGETDGTLTSTIEGVGFVTPTAVDAANRLIAKDWNVLGVPLALTSGVTYNVGEFPKIWIDNLLYNTAVNKGNTFVAASAYPLTGQVSYNSVTEINLSSKSLTTVFNNTLLSKFTGLKNLYIMNNSISSVDTQSLLLLRRLYISNNNNIVLTNIEFCTNLEILYADNCGLSNIDFTNFPNLQRLFVVANNFTNLDFSLSNDLQLLRITNNTFLQSLNVDNCSVLIEIEAHNSILNSLNIDDCVALTKVYSQNANLTAFSVANNTLLNNVRIPNNQLNAAVNSQILIDLNSHGKSNGYFQSSIFGGGTLTTAGLAAKAALLLRGWTIVGL